MPIRISTFRHPAYFTYLFGKMLLEKPIPADIDLLKIEVPVFATPETPWKITRLARHPYYEPSANRPGSWDEPYYIDGLPRMSLDEVAHDTDIYAFCTIKRFQ